MSKKCEAEEQGKVPITVWTVVQHPDYRVLVHETGDFVDPKTGAVSERGRNRITLFRSVDGFPDQMMFEGPYSFERALGWARAVRFKANTTASLRKNVGR